MKKNLVCPLLMLVFILVFLLTGCACFKQDKPSSDIQILQKKETKEDHALSANYYYLESRIHLHRKAYKKAIISLEKAMANDPDSFMISRDLVHLYLSENNPKTMKLLKKMVSQFPDYYAAWFYLGEHYLSEKQYDLAKIQFLKTLELEPDLVAPRFHLIKILGIQNIQENNLKILTLYEEIFNIEPDNYRAQLGIALHYYKTGVTAKATRLFMGLGQDIENDSKLIMVAVDEFLSDKRYEDAIIIFSQMLNGNPENSTLNFFTGMAYEMVEDFEKAITHLKKGLKQSPENTSLLFRLGAVQDKTGFKEDSLDTMKKIIGIDPDDASALNYLGYSYAELGIHLDEALSLIKRACEIKPDNGYITDSLGWVYYKKKDYKKAIEYLEKAAILTSFETIISDHLGDAYQKINQFKKALDTYQKAVSNAKEDDKEIVIELKKKINDVLKKINE